MNFSMVPMYNSGIILLDLVQITRIIWIRSHFMKKKDFILASSRLVAAVDFIKWTSTFGEGAIRQMETPVSGVRLAPGLSRLFGIAHDDAGIMLTMHEKEAPWLEHLPVECAFIGFSDELLIVTEWFSLFDVPFERVGLGVFVPSPDLRADIATQHLIGFGLIREENVVERVNKIIPIYTPERYEQQRSETRQNNSSLFSAS